MKLRNILIYLCILVGIASWLYFYEMRHTRKQKALDEKSARIVHLESDKVVKIALESGARGKIEAQKPADAWVVTAPIKTRADQAAIKSLLYAATEAASEKVILEKDVKWEDYGLEKPDFTLSLSTADKKTEIFFGAPNPAKTSYYVRVDDSPKLLLVADTLKNSLNKSLLDLRDKSVVNIAPEDVNRVVVTRKGVATELQRTGSDTWMMIQPERLKVKSSVITSDLRTIANFDAKEIIDEPKNDPQAYGLGNPEETILLAGKEREQLLLVGKPADATRPGQTEPDRYARIKGNDPVYVLDGRSLKGIRTDIEELKDRSIVSFNPSDIEKVSIELEGKEWLALRDKDNKWTLEKPEKKQRIDTWAISGILWDFKDMEWKSRIKDRPDDPSLEALRKPQLLVSLFRKNEQAPINLKIGWMNQQAPEKDKTPAMDAGAPDRASAKPEAESGPAKAQGKTQGESKDQLKAPDTVTAMVEPEEEKGTVFLLEGSFVNRLREDLNKLLVGK